jgi:hypothetical protein
LRQVPLSRASSTLPRASITFLAVTRLALAARVVLLHARRVEVATAVHAAPLAEVPMVVEVAERLLVHVAATLPR